MAASFPCCPRSQAAPAPGRERDPELRGDAGVTLGAPGRGRIIFLTCEERLSSTPWLFSAVLGAGQLEGCRVAAGRSGRVEEIGSLVLKIR